ncbi:MAG: class I SAM-dependent methyltransferase [Leptolyngbyaceae cyanobacterium bins.302]|nr:class I SAM-dependent methyltransferase [Leptolyngbyaceae cyanobacterium bins.302]
MRQRRQDLRLLPETALIKTGPVDHADWNFRPLLGWIQRMRFKLILSLIPRQPIQRILEVGYGSGILMPELSDRCQELYGIDIHPCNQEVQAQLKEFQVDAHLFSGSAEAMPFEDQFFDCIVAVSSLEFIEHVEVACKELRRVLKPDGCLVMVTPGHSPLVDLGLRLLTGESANRDYGDRRHSLMSAILTHFTIQKRRTFPSIGTSLILLYNTLRLLPRSTTVDRPPEQSLSISTPNLP